MDGYELNKIFGAITGALTVFFAVVFATEIVYAPKSHGGGHGDDHGPKLAYALALETDDAHGGDDVVEEGPSLVELVAAADVASGEKVFRKCAACHAIEKGAGNKQGPALYGILGAQVAAVDGFGYSSAMAAHGGAWTWEELNGFLTKPSDWIDGTAMKFAGLKKPTDRADLMAYLNANSDAPIEPPTE